MRPLTARQEATLAWIRGFIASHGYSPSVRDVGDAMGCANGHGIVYTLAALRAKGRLTWEPLVSRTMRVVEEVSDG